MKSDDQITEEIKAEVRHYRPGVYAWLAVLISSITLPILALVVSLHMNSQAVSRERAARVEAQAELDKNREASRRATCLLIIAQDGVYGDPTSPPVTETGKQAATAWHNMREILHCDER